MHGIPEAVLHGIPEAVLLEFAHVVRDDDYPVWYGKDNGMPVDDVSCTGGGVTALMGACEVGDVWKARLLVQSLGANVTAKDNAGKHVCVARIHPALTKCFLSLPASGGLRGVQVARV